MTARRLGEWTLVIDVAAIGAILILRGLGLI